MGRILNNDGTFKLETFTVSLDKLISEDILELVDIKENYEGYDKEAHKPVGNVVSITYSVFSADLRGRFALKVDGSVPVISAKNLETSKDDVYIKVPLDKTYVRPYKVEFGKVFATIKAPFVELVTD